MARNGSTVDRCTNSILSVVQRYAMTLRTTMPLTGPVTKLHRMLVLAGIGAEMVPPI